jgi:capsular exopolysaccharide synthesis family protein
MRISEEGMQSFRERERAASIETMLQEAQTQISECSAKQHAVSDKLAQVNADLDAARSDLGDTEKLLALPSVVSEPQIAEVVGQIASLESQFALVKLRYRAKHPAYIAIKTQIDLAQQDLNKLLGNVVPLLETMRENLTAQDAALKIERENSEKRLLDVTSKSIEYNDLKRELDSDSALFEAVVSRIKEVDVTKGLSDSSVRIEELAGGAGAVGKSPYSIIFKNFLTGLAVGLAVVIGLHKLDSSFKTVDQIEQFTELTVLAAIPQIGGASASVLGFISREQGRELLMAVKDSVKTLFNNSLPFHMRLSKCLDFLQPSLTCLGNPHRGVALPPESELVVRDDRHGFVAETFRSLRATLAMNPKVQSQRTYLFTSAVPSEGKSFCSANFAISLAQQGMKTLLIDADLRKPMISRIFFNMARKPGLFDILQGSSTLETAIQATSTEGLSILTAGSHASNPSECLSGDGFREIITEALKKYDRVVIDSAPILAVSDTLLIAFEAEIICLVVRSFVTPRRLIKRALKSLEDIHMPPAGIVFNCLPYGKGSYYYYTSGKYYREYGAKAYSG